MFILFTKKNERIKILKVRAILLYIVVVFSIFLLLDIDQTPNLIRNYGKMNFNKIMPNNEIANEKIFITA